MPELPEVETVVRGLQKSVLGRKILSVWIGKSDFIDNPAVEAWLVKGEKGKAVRAEIAEALANALIKYVAEKGGE